MIKLNCVYILHVRVQFMYRFKCAYCANVNKLESSSRTTSLHVYSCTRVHSCVHSKKDFNWFLFYLKNGILLI